MLTDDYWEVFWDLNRMVKERFDAEGISIPFPQRDMHIHHTGAPVVPVVMGDGWIQPSPPKEQEGEQPVERTGESKAELQS